MIKKTITIAYKYRIEYEHKDHYNALIAQLKTKPIWRVGGAGIMPGNNQKVGSYMCSLIENSGTVIDKEA